MIDIFEKENIQIENSDSRDIFTEQDIKPQAIEETPGLPKWLEEIQTPEQITERQAKGPIGILEAAERFNKWEALPYLNAKTIPEDFRIANNMKRIANREQLNERETQELKEFLEDYIDVAARGYTFGGNFVNAGLASFPFMVEAGVAILSLGGSAPSSTAKAISKVGIKKGLQIGARKFVKTGLKGNTKNLAKGIGKAAIGGNTLMPHRLPKQYADLELNSSIGITDKGQVILKDAKNNPATTLLKSLALNTIELGSEMTGAKVFGPGVAMAKRGGQSVLKTLPKPLINKLDELGKTKTGTSFTKMANAKADIIGWNGWFEEIGEEQIAEILKVTLDLDQEQGYSFDQFGRALIPTWDEALTTAGLVSIFGGAAKSSVMLHNKLKENGMQNNFIKKIMENTSQLEKDAILNNFEISAQTENLAKQEELESELTEVYAQKAINAGVDENLAYQTGKIAAVRSRITSEKYGIDPLEDSNNLKIQQGEQVIQQALFQENVAYAGATENEAEQAAQEWQEKGTESKFFKNWFGKSKVVDEENKPLVVYHGTDRDFNEFKEQPQVYTLGSSAGFFFTSSEKMADQYSDRFGYADIQKKKILPNYLNINNPFIIETDKEIELLGLKKEKGQDSFDIIFKLDIRGKRGENIKEHLSKLGYDGIIFKRTNVDTPSIKDIHDVYVAFSPEQIKSVENQGTFSKDTGNIYQQTAYHGSPYKFDEFSLEHLGSGEGNQAYGWGLYFAGKENTAEWYRKNLSGSNVKYNGKDINTFDKYILIEIVNKGKLATLKPFEEKLLSLEYEYSLKDKALAREELKKLTLEYKKLDKIFNKFHKNKNITEEQRKSFYLINNKIDKIQKVLNTNFDFDYTFQEINETKRDIAFIKKVVPNKIEINKGQLYKTEIPEDDSMIFWDKKIEEQPAKVKDILLKLRKEYGTSFYDGRTAYKEISFELDSDKAASLKLNELGIKGIKYLDGTSRSNGEGSYNYVIFDDNAVDIVKTYYQNQQVPKGQVEFDGNKKIISLFENADESTLLHELGHVFLQDIINISATNENAAADLKEINEWLEYNGEEYTREQHEKFARGFEAYVLTQNAPTRSLKGVFEQFKMWLAEIYTKVDDLIEITPQAKKVFDNLFSLEQDKRLTKAKQIVRDARLKANKSQDTKLKKEVKSIIQNAFRVIINTELGKNYDLKNAASVWARNIKNDKFAGQAGNWGTEHSYEDLALDIRSNKYSKEASNFVSGELFIPEDMSEFDSAEFASNILHLYSIEAWEYIANNVNITEYADLEGVEIEYAYILKQYEKGDRESVYLAFYEWLQDVDKLFRADFVERFELETAYIERLEKLDQFEKAKEIILHNANNLTSINSVQEFENVIKAAFDSIKFLTGKDRQRLLYNILSLKTVEDLKNNIDSIIDLTKTMEDVNKRRILANKIYKFVVKTKPYIKQGSKKVGKYNYETNQFIQELKDLNKLKRDDAREELNKEQFDEDNQLTFHEKLKRKFLVLKSQAVIDHSSDFLSSLYQDLLDVKMTGKLAKDAENHEKRLNKQNRTDELLLVLDRKKKAKILTKKYVPLIGNWESAINTIFNRRTKEIYSLLKPESDLEIIKQEEKREFVAKAIEAYGYKVNSGALGYIHNNEKLNQIVLNNLAEKYNFFQYQAGQMELEPHSINKMNLIGFYIWSKNPVLKERLINQFGSKEKLAEAMTYLTKEDKAFGDVLQRTANKFYAEANRVFIKKYAMELPKVENYFPSKVERISEVDLLNDFTANSTTPSAVKTRSTNTELIMREINPVQVLYQHIDQMTRFIHLTGTLDNYMQIFKNPTLKTRISNLYGEKTYFGMMQVLARSTFKEKNKANDEISSALNRVFGNWISSRIGGKLSITGKQLLSAVNYSSDMPFHIWAKGHIKAIADFKGTLEFMLDFDPYLRARFESGGQDQYLQQSLDDSSFILEVGDGKIAKILEKMGAGKVSTIKEYFTLNTRLGDIGAIVLGGKPYVDYLMNKKGYTKERALLEFRNSTLRSQQAAVESSLSNYQATRQSPANKIFIAFTNTAYQYFRKAADSIISFSNGDIDKKQMVKELVIYTFLNNFMFRTAGSLSLLAFLYGDDDNELGKDFLKSLFDLNVTRFPIIGDFWEYVLNLALGDKNFNPQMPVLKEINDIFTDFNKIKEDDFKIEDLFDVMGNILDLALGVPASTVINSGGGVGDIAQGDVDKGILRTLGYSDYTANKATNRE